MHWYYEQSEIGVQHTNIKALTEKVALKRRSQIFVDTKSWIHSIIKIFAVFASTGSFSSNLVDSAVKVTLFVSNSSIPIIVDKNPRTQILLIWHQVSYINYNCNHHLDHKSCFYMVIVLKALSSYIKLETQKNIEI